MGRPEFVVIGHVVRDLAPEGWRLGGSAAFAAVQAERLGLNVGVVTSAGPDVDLGDALPGVELAVRQADVTTTFENVYEDGARHQHVSGQAQPLDLEDVPVGWREIPITLLGPVCGEVASGLGDGLTGPLVGVGAQGWLRRLDADGNVQRESWAGSPFWSGCHVLFVSEEDIEGRRDEIERWVADVPVVAVTDAGRGASVYAEGRCRSISGLPAEEVDPTGAGDVFAAAFLVRYHETGDLPEAARFATAAASVSVEGIGIEAVAERRGIEARMAQHPEVLLE